MGQEILNNSETLLNIRNKINNNFTEVYSTSCFCRALTSTRITNYNSTDVFIFSALPIELPQAGTYEFNFSTIHSRLSSNRAVPAGAIIGLSSNKEPFTIFYNQDTAVANTNTHRNIVYSDSLNLDFRNISFAGLPVQLRNDNNPLLIDLYNSFNGVITVSNKTTLYYYISSGVTFTEPSIGISFYILNYKPIIKTIITD